MNSKQQRGEKDEHESDRERTVRGLCAMHVQCLLYELPIGNILEKSLPTVQPNKVMTRKGDKWMHA